jgi:Holliday junction resolvase RusA-like endonuclease
VAATAGQGQHPVSGPAIGPGDHRRVALMVFGTPTPQGSKQAFAYAKADGKLGVRVTDPADRRHKIANWRQDVTAAGRQIMDGAPPLDGPLSVSMTFTLARPTGLVKRLRWRDRLVPARHSPWRRPDLTKLARSTEDALTAAGVWLDDAQIISLHLSKTYPGEQSHALPSPGVCVFITQLSTVRVDIEPAPPERRLPPLIDEDANEAALF